MQKVARIEKSCSKYKKMPRNLWKALTLVKLIIFQRKKTTLLSHLSRIIQRNFQKLREVFKFGIVVATVKNGV